MPTSAALMATAPRIRSASAASAPSASGNPLRRSVLVKVGLQYQLRCDAITHAAMLARLHSGGRQRSRRGLGSVPLVNKRDFDVETAGELSREAACPRRHLVFRAIGVG